MEKDKYALGTNSKEHDITYPNQSHGCPQTKTNMFKEISSILQPHRIKE